MESGMRCPLCGNGCHEMVNYQAYVEVGEWLGDGYEIEHEVDVYECRECGMRFFA